MIDTPIIVNVITAASNILSLSFGVCIISYCVNNQLRFNWGNAIARTLGRKTTALTAMMNMNMKDRNHKNELVLPSLRVAGLSGHLKSLLIITPYVTKCAEKKN